MPRIPLGDWVTDAVNFLTKHGKPVFSAISDVVGGLVHGLSHLLSAPPSLALAAVVAMACWWLRGLAAGVLTMAGMILIDALGQWDAAGSRRSRSSASARCPGSSRRWSSRFLLAHA
jgi:glycine betaine/proline transport system substrate-binding protein